MCLGCLKSMISNRESEEFLQNLNQAKKKTKKIMLCDASDLNSNQKISIEDEISNYLNMNLNFTE